MWLYHTVMSPNDVDGMANSVDPDQTAPLGAVWSGSVLFAQACLSENLGSLRYDMIWIYTVWPDLSACLLYLNRYPWNYLHFSGWCMFGMTLQQQEATWPQCQHDTATTGGHISTAVSTWQHGTWKEAIAGCKLSGQTDRQTPKTSDAHFFVAHGTSTATPLSPPAPPLPLPPPPWGTLLYYVLLQEFLSYSHTDMTEILGLSITHIRDFWKRSKVVTVCGQAQEPESCSDI